MHLFWESVLLRLIYDSTAFTMGYRLEGRAGSSQEPCARERSRVLLQKNTIIVQHAIFTALLRKKRRITSFRLRSCLKDLTRKSEIYVGAILYRVRLSGGSITQTLVFPAH